MDKELKEWFIGSTLCSEKFLKTAEERDSDDWERARTVNKKIR